MIIVVLWSSDVSAHGGNVDSRCVGCSTIMQATVHMLDAESEYDAPTHGQAQKYVCTQKHKQQCAAVTISPALFLAQISTHACSSK